MVSGRKRTIKKSKFSSVSSYSSSGSAKRHKKRSIKKSDFEDLDLKVQRLYDKVNNIESRLSEIEQIVKNVDRVPRGGKRSRTSIEDLTKSFENL